MTVVSKKNRTRKECEQFRLGIVLFREDREKGIKHLIDISVTILNDLTILEATPNIFTLA